MLVVVLLVVMLVVVFLVRDVLSDGFVPADPLREDRTLLLRVFIRTVCCSNKPLQIISSTSLTMATPLFFFLMDYNYLVPSA